MRSVLLLLSVFPVATFRAVSSGENRANESLGGINPIAVFSNMPKGSDITGELWASVGTIDPKKDMGAELKRVSVHVFGSVLGMINPILGAAFSIIKSLFFGGPPNTFVQDILDRVKDMIRSSISDWSRSHVRTTVSNLMNVIQTASTLDKWKFIEGSLEMEAPGVFNTSCWMTPQDSSACTNWRTENGGGEALIFELQFTKLMLSTELELQRLKHQSTLGSHLRRAGYLCLYHVKAFKAWRLGQVQTGTSRCAQHGRRPPKGKCTITSSKDKYTGKSNELPGCSGVDRTCSGNGCVTSLRNRVNYEVKTCNKKWLDQVGKEIDDMAGEADILWQAIDHLFPR